MARTKASVGAKVASGKSFKATTVSCAPSPSSVAAGHSGSRKYSGGNPVCHREVPKWQKSITNFFPIVKESGNLSQEAGVSDATTTRLPEIICDNVPKEPTEDSDEIDEEKSETLNGENCHKIQEYFEVQGGDAKTSDRDNEDEVEDEKSENGENGDEVGTESEIEKGRAPKRNLEEDEIERVNKKTKLLQDVEKDECAVQN